MDYPDSISTYLHIWDMEVVWDSELTPVLLMSPAVSLITQSEKLLN